LAAPTNEYDRAEQERERAEQRLDALRAAIAEREDRDRAARLAKAAEEREYWRRHHEEVNAKLAAAASRKERLAKLVATGITIEDVLLDLVDRLGVIEAALHRQEPRS
jgi:hypothetical protein